MSATPFVSPATKSGGGDERDVASVAGNRRVEEETGRVCLLAGGANRDTGRGPAGRGAFCAWCACARKRPRQQHPRRHQNERPSALFTTAIHESPHSTANCEPDLARAALNCQRPTRASPCRPTGEDACAYLLLVVARLSERHEVARRRSRLEAVNTRRPGQHSGDS